jgi:hypothetical protein
MPAEGGAFYKGTKGTIMAGVYGHSPQIVPEDKPRLRVADSRFVLVP